MTAPVPPPTPAQKALARVIKVSRLNGWSVVIVAGLGVLITLLLGDWLGIAIGLLIAGAGGMEVHGGRRLQRRDPDGMKWLVRSQMLLLSLILAYCASRLGSFDDQTVLGNLTPDMEAMLKEAGINRGDIMPMVRSMFLAIYGGFAVVTIFYQGGMALYYRGKTALVTEALNAPPVVPLPPLPGNGHSGEPRPPPGPIID